MELTEQNYQKGFLIDDEALAGVSEDPSQKDYYLAYWIKLETGEIMQAYSFPKLPLALEWLTSLNRPWVFEKASACGGGKCGGANGSCDPSQCGKICAT